VLLVPCTAGCRMHFPWSTCCVDSACCLLPLYLLQLCWRLAQLALVCISSWCPTCAQPAGYVPALLPTAAVLVSGAAGCGVPSSCGVKKCFIDPACYLPALLPTAAVLVSGAAGCGLSQSRCFCSKHCVNPACCLPACVPACSCAGVCGAPGCGLHSLV
jgi:hypothetical protein